MPKFYCDYCDTYLTHNTPSVRKTHCAGLRQPGKPRILFFNLVYCRKET